MTTICPNTSRVHHRHRRGASPLACTAVMAGIVAGVGLLLAADRVATDAAAVVADVPDHAPAARIDLGTEAGIAQVGGTWRIHDASIVETEFRAAGPDGRPGSEPNTTYGFEPKAGTRDFDDSSWETIGPTTLEVRRSTGKVCFMWYRITATIPDRIADFNPTGATVVFDTVVDDYGEVWVNGELPRRLGQQGGSVVAGFNAPNRLIVGKDVQPGDEITIAIFAMNGPISAEPENYIFLRYAHLDFYPGG